MCHVICELAPVAYRDRCIHCIEIANVQVIPTREPILQRPIRAKRLRLYVSNTCQAYELQSIYVELSFD